MLRFVWDFKNSPQNNWSNSCFLQGAGCRYAYSGGFLIFPTEWESCSSFIKISALEHKLCGFISFISHLGGHLGFSILPKVSMLEPS